MLTYTLSDLARIMNGRLTGDGRLPVQQLLIDSRSLFSPEGTLFFALRGQRHDGPSRRRIPQEGCLHGISRPPDV